MQARRAIFSYRAKRGLRRAAALARQLLPHRKLSEMDTVAEVAQHRHTVFEIDKERNGLKAPRGDFAKVSRRRVSTKSLPAAKRGIAVAAK
jgi:hypothetical protein